MKMPGMYPPSCRFDEERSRSLRCARPLGPFVAMRDPRGVFLRHETLHALGQQRIRASHGGVGSRARGEEVLLMLEPLAGRAVGCPVLLVLLELLKPLEHDDQRATTAHQPYRRLDSRRHRDRGGDDDLPDLEQLEPALVVPTLGVVPGDLVLEPRLRRRAMQEKLLLDAALGRAFDGLGLVHLSLLTVVSIPPLGRCQASTRRRLPWTGPRFQARACGAEVAAENRPCRRLPFPRGTERVRGRAARARGPASASAQSAPTALLHP